MSTEIKDAIEKIGRTFEEYKKTNDERLEQIQKTGKADPLLTEKLAKMDVALSELEKVKTNVEALEKKANRPGRTDDKPEQAEHAKAFGEFMRKGVTAGLQELEQKALVGNSDPDGGFLMTREMETTIDRILGQDVAMRRLATIRPVGGQSYKKAVNVGGATSRWAGETEESTESNTPVLRELEFPVHKLEAEPQATNDSLEDSFTNLEAWLSDEVSIAFGEGESDAFINGNGIKKPRGLLSYTNVIDSSYAWGSIGYTKTAGAASFAASNPSDALFSLIHSLKRGYRNGAAFLMNDLTLAAIRKFKDSTGNYLWTPGLQEGVASRLLGYQVENDDNMPDLGANEFPIAFGDFKRAYVIVDRRGISVLRDPYTKKGWVKFYTTKRVGGGIQNFEAVKLMKCEA